MVVDLTVDPEAILDDEFWQEQEEELRTVLLALLTEAALDGVEIGVQQLVDAGVVWSDIPTITAIAIEYAETMTDAILGLVSTTNKVGVGKIIANWIKSGEALPALLARLKQFGVVHADMTGITEVTRAFSAGQRQAWTQSGAVYARQWWTVRDERVCPICRPLHGTVILLDETFTRLDEDEEGNLLFPGVTVGTLLTAAGFELNPFGDPPAHPRCRCIMLPLVYGYGLVTPSARVVEMYRAWQRKHNIWAEEMTA